jgi:hypothetical protein
MIRQTQILVSVSIETGKIWSVSQIYSENGPHSILILSTFFGQIGSKTKRFIKQFDQHLPSQINFNYYSGAEFLNNQDILDLSTKNLLEYYIAILEVLQVILIKFLFY